MVSFPMQMIDKSIFFTLNTQSPTAIWFHNGGICCTCFSLFVGIQKKYLVSTLVEKWCKSSSIPWSLCSFNVFLTIRIAIFKFVLSSGAQVRYQFFFSRIRGLVWSRKKSVSLEGKNLEIKDYFAYLVAGVRCGTDTSRSVFVFKFKCVFIELFILKYKTDSLFLY